MYLLLPVSKIKFIYRSVNDQKVVLQENRFVFGIIMQVLSLVNICKHLFILLWE